MNDSETARPFASNPYAAPVGDDTPTNTPADLSDDSDLGLLQAFAGRRADYYLRKWSSVLAGHGVLGGFNGAAFGLSFLWLGYRKLYLPAIVVCMLILLPIMTETTGITTQESYRGSWILKVHGFSVLVAWLHPLGLGLLGNRLYWMRGRAIIARGREAGMPGDQLIQFVRSNGGASWGTALAVLTVFLTVAIGGWAAILHYRGELRWVLEDLSYFLSGV